MRWISGAVRAILSLIMLLFVLACILIAVMIYSPETTDSVISTLQMTGLAELLPEEISEDILPEILQTEETGGFAEAAATEESETEEEVFDTAFYPYYGMLDELSKKAYVKIYQAYLNYEETVSLEEIGLDKEQFLDAWYAVYNDHPELFWMTGSCTYNSYEDGTVTEATLGYYTFEEGQEEAERLFAEAAREILQEAAKLSSDYEKEIYIHDVLAERIVYNEEEEYSQSAYSALVKGSSVCAGYARAFQYLLMESGIPCYFCSGDCSGDHAWNIVMLDGEYYNVDLTWDDAAGSYAFFNRTDEDFAETHTRTGASVDLPACQGETYRNREAMPREEMPDYRGGGRGGITEEGPGGRP